MEQKEQDLTKIKVQYQEQSKITIGDVADALGISKTTVSRAISGKGRIGEETRQKVLNYINEHHYRPSVVAKGLAQQRTYNIGWIMPGDAMAAESSFFQTCMGGISSVSTASDYDILVMMVYDDDNSQLQRILNNKKVDGLILGRTQVKDERIEMLIKSEIPFVAIGSSLNDKVIQIDNDHVKACQELTEVLLSKGMKRLALIGGGNEYMVNQNRQKGYFNAFESKGISVRKDLVYMDCLDETQVGAAVESSLREQVECIVCMDDSICATTLRKLQRMGKKVPDDVKVASFYNSHYLDDYKPSITSLHYDPAKLGSVACQTLLNYIEGNPVTRKVYLDYEVVLKGSTQ